MPVVFVVLFESLFKQTAPFHFLAPQNFSELYVCKYLSYKLKRLNVVTYRQIEEKNQVNFDLNPFAG